MNTYFIFNALKLPHYNLFKSNTNRPVFFRVLHGSSGAPSIVSEVFCLVCYVQQMQQMANVALLEFKVHFISKATTIVKISGKCCL